MSDLNEQLHFKDTTLRHLESLAAKRGTSESCRLANLNQALMQAKQVCAQLTDENDQLKHRERDLIKKVNEMEKKLLVNSSGTTNCKNCLERETVTLACPSTPKGRPYQSHTTPAKPIPQETQLDSLLIENTKLKQSLQCIQSNFQSTSQKNAALKRESKEMQTTITELQDLMDSTTLERDNLLLKVSDNNKQDQHVHDRSRVDKMSGQIAELEEELDKLQKQNLDLQDKLQKRLKQNSAYQDTFEKLDEQVKTLKQDKTSTNNQLSELQAELATLHDDYTALKESHKATMKLDRDMPDMEGIYVHKLKSLTSEKQEIQDKLDAAASSVDSACQEVRLLTESQKSREAKIASLEARNIALSRENKHLYELSEEKNGQQTKYLQLLEQYEEKDVHIDELIAKQNDLKSQILNLEKNKTKLTHEADRNWELAKKFQKELEVHETRVFELDLLNKEKQHWCTSLEDKMDELKTELASAKSQKVRFEDEVAKLLTRLEEVEQCNFELTFKLSDIQIQADSTTMATSDTKLKNYELEKKLEACQATVLDKEAQLSDLKCTTELMERENATLLSQVTSLSKMVSTRSSKVDSLQLHLEKYESDAREVMNKVSALETDQEHDTQTKAELEEKIDSFAEKLSEASSFKKEAETTILSLKLQVKKLEECNNFLESINTDFQEKLQKQLNMTDELKESLEEGEKHSGELQRELGFKSDSLCEALKEINFMKKNPGYVSANDGTENMMVTSTRSKVKGILKNSGGGTLRPIQNLVD